MQEHEDSAPREFLYVTREVEFSAAHRLYREELSSEENEALFGKCALPYGHGHNYVLQVTFKGEADPKTGMVFHFAKMKQLLTEVVATPLDHRHLNHDVELLKGVLPTSENLIRVLWKEIKRAIQKEPFVLCKLKLSSTSRNWVEYFGPDYD